MGRQDVLSGVQTRVYQGTPQQDGTVLCEQPFVVRPEELDVRLAAADALAQVMGDPGGFEVRRGYPSGDGWEDSAVAVTVRWSEPADGRAREFVGPRTRPLPPMPPT